MTNRRELLHAGLAAATLPLGSAAYAVSAGGSAARGMQIYKALYDVRFPASVGFAARVAARGVALAPMSGDMTRFWYDDLYHRWKERPVAIAGMTGYGALFCLEQLASAERLRVILRVRHSSAVDGVIHEIEGPDTLVPWLSHSVSAPDWIGAMADAVSRCRSGRAKAAAVAYTLDPAIAAAASEPLYSWVIGPPGRG
jgi:hypothetical protein